MTEQRNGIENEGLLVGGTLYDKLKAVESINLGLESARRYFLSESVKYRNFPGYLFVAEDVPEAPIIDVTESQMEIILSTRDRGNNSILNEAINGETSIEEVLNGLAEKNKGWRKCMPRRKDEGYNQRLRNLADLIPFNPKYYEKRGIFAQNRPFGGAVFGGLVWGLGLNAFPYFIDSSIPISISKRLLIFGLGAASGVCFPLTYIRVDLDHKKLPWNEARYLDDKLEKFRKSEIK